MNCPKCQETSYYKNGKAMGRQRYKCKQCGCNFTQSKKQGYSLEKRLMALKLYLEGMGFRGTGRVLGVSNVTVLNWIRNFGESVKEYVTENMPNNIQETDIVEIDEMWHFTVKKNARFGSGSQSIGSIKKSSHLPLVVALKKPSEN